MSTMYAYEILDGVKSNSDSRSGAAGRSPDPPNVASEPMPQPEALQALTLAHLAFHRAPGSTMIPVSCAVARVKGA